MKKYFASIGLLFISSWTVLCLTSAFDFMLKGELLSAFILFVLAFLSIKSIFWIYKNFINSKELHNNSSTSVLEIGKYIDENKKLLEDNTRLNKLLLDLGSLDYQQVKENTLKLIEESELKCEQTENRTQNCVQEANQKCSDLEIKSKALQEQITSTNEDLILLTKKVQTQTNKLSQSRELVKSIENVLTRFLNYDPSHQDLKLLEFQQSRLEELAPSVILKLHCMDIKELRKAYRDNDKLISRTMERYASRYTTKTNRSIYKLMTIALSAELQNILYNLKYEKLVKSIDDLQKITKKYLQIVADGNQSIATTITKFIGEIEYLFINAIKIEYNYYVKKEQTKQEQLAIRNQIREEAEELKALETEKKKVEQEESKFIDAIEILKEQLINASNEEIEKMNARILELQVQLATVVIKKEEITKLANGKAGNVYIISNLGSFGENAFKVGMTRRLDPQDRVNELGDASVPFKFDVHCFIFSDDAVSLEKKLHHLLKEKRVNRVNLRKEFFNTNVGELEILVTEIEPTAEFNITMLAEEYRQTLSCTENYTSEVISNNE